MTKNLKFNAPNIDKFNQNLEETKKKNTKYAKSRRKVQQSYKHVLKQPKEKKHMTLLDRNSIVVSEDETLPWHECWYLADCNLGMADKRFETTREFTCANQNALKNCKATICPHAINIDDYERIYKKTGIVMGGYNEFEKK